MPEAMDGLLSMLWARKSTDSLDTCCGTSRAGCLRLPRLASHFAHLHCHTLGLVQDGALLQAAAQLRSMACISGFAQINRTARRLAP